MNAIKATAYRATFQHIPARRTTSPTEREIRWLKHIERHGPQSSTYLHKLTSDTHRDPDTSRRQLQKLRAGGLLHLPPQQRATERAEFNPYIYDLTLLGKRALFDRSLAEETFTPTGHWVHRYMTACVSSSIDITARRHGVEYIPAHQILERAKATMSVPLDHRQVTPDQLFGLNYGGRYRFFCVEADRSTEPRVSAGHRKSWRLMLENYRNLIAGGIYRDHYRLSAPMFLMVVLTSRSHQERFRNLAGRFDVETRRVVLTQTIDGFNGAFRPPLVADKLFAQPWERAGLERVAIS